MAERGGTQSPQLECEQLELWVPFSLTFSGTESAILLLDVVLVS